MHVLFSHVNIIWIKGNLTMYYFNLCPHTASRSSSAVLYLCYTVTSCIWTRFFSVDVLLWLFELLKLLWWWWWWIWPILLLQLELPNFWFWFNCCIKLWSMIWLLVLLFTRIDGGFIVALPHPLTLPLTLPLPIPLLLAQLLLDDRIGGNGGITGFPAVVNLVPIWCCTCSCCCSCFCCSCCCCWRYCSSLLDVVCCWDVCGCWWWKCYSFNNRKII